ncbi:MAG: hypothetical protein LEGION0398_MBIBDBAK_00997 [Legionellaceae bacterium]
MLPIGFGQYCQWLINPDVCGFFTAGRTKAALAAKGNYFCMCAIFVSAMIGFVPSDHRAATQDIDDIIDDGRTNMLSSFLIKIPPAIICF